MATEPTGRRGKISPIPLSKRAIVASAAKIDLGDQRYARAKSATNWQTECWGYYDDIGEVKYGCNYMGNALARLRLFVGRMEQGVEEPTEVEDDQEATDVLDRLHSSLGGRPEIQRKFGVNAEVAGECYLLGLEDADTEEWSIRSVDEITRNSSGKWELREGPDSQDHRALTEKDYVARLWLPHARWSKQADSPLRGVRSVCSELLTHELANRGTARSRAASAGFLLVPDELSFGGIDPTLDDSSQDSDQDPFFRELLASMMTAIQNEGSASAVVPILIRGAAEALKEFRYVPMERPADKDVAAKLEALIKRLAQGLNVPPEIILGIADVNHWGAWMVDENTFSAHVEPLAVALCEMLTLGYLRPMLDTAGHEGTQDLVVWYDATELVTHPNRGADADKGYEIYALSSEAWRRHHGFPESDAPDNDELLLRIVLTIARGLGPDVGAELLKMSGIAPDIQPPDPLQGTVPTAPNAPAQPAPTPVGPDTVQPGPPDSAVASAAAAVVYAGINPLLRRAEGQIAQLPVGVQATVASIDALIASSCVLEPMTVYRAWNHMPQQLVAPGVIMMEHGYTAGVRDPEQARMSCSSDDCTIVAIEVDLGQRASWMGDRLLLPRDSAFEMVSSDGDTILMRLVQQ